VNPLTEEDNRIWMSLIKSTRPGNRGRITGVMYSAAIKETDPGWNDYYIMMSATKTRVEMTRTVRRWQLGGFSPTRCRMFDAR
jgi:hypothetical protein